MLLNKTSSISYLKLVFILYVFILVLLLKWTISTYINIYDSFKSFIFNFYLDLLVVKLNKYNADIKKGIKIHSLKIKIFFKTSSSKRINDHRYKTRKTIKTIFVGSIPNRMFIVQNQFTM